jgi:hypothetical protein
VPGCTNFYEKTSKSEKKISYLSFPKLGVSPAQDIWRKQLVAAVRRADSCFKADTHRICSEHFEPKCLVYHGKLLAFS